MLFYPDLFSFHDEKMSDQEQTTRSQTHLIYDGPEGTHDYILDHDHFSLTHSNRDAAGNTAASAGRPSEPSLGQVVRTDNARVLHGAYREGEDYLNDVLSRTDRELMRISPQITDPEYVHTILEIYCRGKHLEGCADRINKIAAYHLERIQQERLGPAADQ